MPKIEPMTVEQFFAETTSRFESQKVDLRIWRDNDPKDNGGGWVAGCQAALAFGDTIEEAIRALHDHVMRNPSKRCRLNPPYFSSDFTAKKWSECRRISYDYRAKDWEPPQ